MKIRIKSGDCPSYLTVGKVYEAWDSDIEYYLYYITDDKGETRLIYLEDCDHLDGGEWETVNEEA